MSRDDVPCPRCAVAARKRTEVRLLWDEGARHVGDHSAWEAYNAAAELLDHNRALYPTRTGAFRAASLLTGQLAELKNCVLDNLVNYALPF